MALEPSQKCIVCGNPAYGGHVRIIDVSFMGIIENDSQRFLCKEHKEELEKALDGFFKTSTFTENQSINAIPTY